MIKPMRDRFKIAIGLSLILAVLGMFFSAGVPMTKSVLNAKHLSSVFLLHATVALVAPVTAMLSSEYISDVAHPTSGTELINRLCSRIC